MKLETALEISGRIEALIDNGRLVSVVLHKYELIHNVWRVVVWHSNEQDYFTSQEIKWLDAAIMLDARNWLIQPTEDGASVELVID